MEQPAPGPLAGVRVMEVAVGISAVGAGLASCLPGALLRDLGADVTRVESGGPATLDAGVEWARIWNRGKRVISVDEDQLVSTVGDLASDADIALFTGEESRLEGRGLSYQCLGRDHPRLIVGRIRPGCDEAGPLPDLELLVHARTGVLTQLRGHRPGPVFCRLPLGGAGAALAVTTGVLACLYERIETGSGGWVETSLYDGLLAMLPMIVGRVEHPSPATEGKWTRGDPIPALSFRCIDGEYLQLWFGAKGAYEAFLQHVGDAPSDAGYAADMRTGEIIRRSARWAEMFERHDRAHWLSSLAGHAFRCEPVLRPGQALLDPHVLETGLAVEHQDPDLGPITVVGPIARVVPAPGDGTAATTSASGPAGSWIAEGSPVGRSGTRLLDGVHVLDLSAYLAGPVAAVVLAELGADVVKVEPVTGDAHRGVEPMYAAGQRGKRVVAVDLKSPEAVPILGRLFQWSDVVHHNSRLGLSDRLGYDEATVRAANPDVVYCHASGFGSAGPRATLAANDHLMQALCGAEAAAGGEGNGPTYVDWGTIDIASGWVAACAIVAALYARRRTGTPQSVSSTLLGAGLMLESGAFASGGKAVGGPAVDAAQTGYGAAYRIYRAQDGAWLALAIPDQPAWRRLLQVVVGAGLPGHPPPLRTPGSGRQAEETVLEGVFAGRPARDWLASLGEAGVPAELVAEPGRQEFVERLIDDPVSRQLGRLVAFEWGARGRLEQTAFPARVGPAPRPGAPARIPNLGQDTEEVLTSLGFGPAEIFSLASSGTIKGAARSAAAPYPGN